MTTEAGQPTPSEAAPVAQPPATATWADIAPRQFVDRSWQRWWPVAAGGGVLFFWVWLTIRFRPDLVAVMCSGIIALLVIVFFLFLMERSIKVVTVDSAGLHARHGLGATTHLPWERITDFNGGGRYGLPLTLISSDARLVLHRRLTDWPELYALVQRARPELWTRLDPSRLKSSISVLFVAVVLLQLPNAILLIDRVPLVGFITAGVLILWLILFPFYEPRSLILSSDGLLAKYPFHSRFVPKIAVAAFTFESRPFWRPGVKVQRRNGRKLHLGIMSCGEAYMLAVLNDWLAGGVGNGSE